MRFGVFDHMDRSGPDLGRLYQDRLAGPAELRPPGTRNWSRHLPDRARLEEEVLPALAGVGALRNG
jgi:hypothetical protein